MPKIIHDNTHKNSTALFFYRTPTSKEKQQHKTMTRQTRVTKKKVHLEEASYTLYY